MLALPLSLPDRPEQRLPGPRAPEQRLPARRPPKHRPRDLPECGYGFDRRGCHGDGGGQTKRHVRRQNRPPTRHRPESRPGECADSQPGSQAGCPADSRRVGRPDGRTKHRTSN
jgi:hypothetical protein